MSGGWGVRGSGDREPSEHRRIRRGGTRCDLLAVRPDHTDCGSGQRAAAARAPREHASVTGDEMLHRIDMLPCAGSVPSVDEIRRRWLDGETLTSCGPSLQLVTVTFRPRLLSDRGNHASHYGTIATAWS